MLFALAVPFDLAACGTTDAEANADDETVGSTGGTTSTSTTTAESTTSSTTTGDGDSATDPTDTSSTGDGDGDSATDSTASSSTGDGDGDICEAYAAHILSCFPDTGYTVEELAMGCMSSIEYNTANYGADCGSAVEDFFACLSAADCDPLTDDCAAAQAAWDLACVSTGDGDGDSSGDGDDPDNLSTGR